jgi:hypothetical protein
MPISRYFDSLDRIKLMCHVSLLAGRTTMSPDSSSSHSIASPGTNWRRFRTLAGTET